MKGAAIASKRKLVVRDVSDPVLDKDEVLIKVQYCGICGSDLHIFIDGLNLSIGHEFSGDIVDMGSDVKGWAIGDSVVLEPSGCGECYWCKRGQIGLCDRLFASATRPRVHKTVGAFATYVKAKYYKLLRLSDGMTYEQGAIVEATAVALSAVNK